MRQLLRLITFVLCGLQVDAQPTANVLTSVYQVRFNGVTATAFLLDYEDRQYFVTARHVVESAGEKATVEMLGPSSKDWTSYPVTVLKGENKCVDVAILVPNDKKLSNAEPIPYSYTFTLGQEVYFLGFPYGLYTTFGDRGGFPLIKHAYLSARVSCSAIYLDGDKDEMVLLLDGLSNLGFSGGPVIAPDIFSPYPNIRAQKLIGVISGFRNENSPLRVGGNVVPNASTITNTGIIIATPIESAVELIKSYVGKQKKP